MQNHKFISSPSNSQYKQLKKLVNNAKSRRLEQATLLDGIHLLTSLNQNNQKPEEIFLKEGVFESNQEIADCVSLFPNIPVTTISQALFDDISPVDTPTGIFALYRIPSIQPRVYEFGILVDRIQDPGNLGTMMRTIAAAGAQAIYLSKGCTDAWSPKVLRAAMGAHFHLDIFENADLSQQAKNFSSVVATSLHASDSLYQLDLTGSLAFLFGNEGAGLPDELLSTATNQVTIPMPGNTESLNVAAATAICVFERVRQLECK